MSEEIRNPAGAGSDEIAVAVRAPEVPEAVAPVAAEEPFIAGLSSDTLTEKTTIWENYAAAGILNLDANNDALTSQAQEAYKEAYCSADGTTFVAAAEEKEKKKEDAVNALESQAEEREERKQRREEWDAEKHKVGQYEFTGAQLHAAYEYLQDKKNVEKFQQELMLRENLTKEQAEKRTTELQRFLALQEKARNNEPLTEKEKYDLAHPSAQVANDANAALTLKENGFIPALQGEEIKRKTAETKTSIEEGSNDFSASATPTASFTSSAPNEIKSGVQPTEEFNAKANIVAIAAKPPEVKTMAATAAVNSEMAFG